MDVEDLIHFDGYVTKLLSGTDKRLIVKATQILQMRLVLDIIVGFFNVSSLGCSEILVCFQILLLAGSLQPTTDMIASPQHWAISISLASSQLLRSSHL